MKTTTYISQRVWRAVDEDVRKAILNVYRQHDMGNRKDIIGKFASDIVDKLHLVGEGPLAFLFLRPDDPTARWDGSEWVIPSQEIEHNGTV